MTLRDAALSSTSQYAIRNTHHVLRSEAMNRRNLLSISLVYILMSLVISLASQDMGQPALAQGSTFYVATTGSDSTGDGSSGNEWATTTELSATTSSSRAGPNCKTPARVSSVASAWSKPVGQRFSTIPSPLPPPLSPPLNGASQRPMPNLPTIWSATT